MMSAAAVSAGSERRSTARQIQSKLTEFVCPSATRSLRWLGTALDGQTDSIKIKRIRLSVDYPFASLARNGA
jgi:hypothetical protein